MKSFYKFPLQIITSFFCLGIILEQVFHIDFPYWISISLLITLVFLLISLRKEQSDSKIIAFGIITCLLFINFGAQRKFDTQYKNNEFHFGKKITTYQKNIVFGSIVSQEKPSIKFNKYLVEIHQINRNKTEGKLLLYLSKKDSIILIPGDQIAFKKGFETHSKKSNPHSFEYSSYLENKNVSHTLYCYENEILKVGTKNTLEKTLYHFKQKVKNQFNNSTLSEQTQSIINALLFGEKAFIDSQLLNEYSKVGIIHILAISGLHIAILYFFIGFVLSPINRIKNGRLINYLITLVFLWSFALLTGFSPSVTRAVTMFSLFGLAKILQRDSNTYNVLFISAFFILLFQPNYLFDVGFQLSYAAVFSIVAFQPYFKYFYFSKNRIVKYFVDIVLVSFAAQVGVLPLSLYYFHLFPLLFFVANLFVIPLVSALLILSIINCIVFLFPKCISNLIFEILELISQVMNTGIQKLAHLEYISIENISFNGYNTFFSMCLLLSFLVWLYHKKRRNYMVVISVIIALFLSLIYGFYKGNKSEELVIFDSKQLIIGIKEKEKITFLTDSMELNKTIIRDYTRGNFNTKYQVEKTNHLIIAFGKQIKIPTNQGVHRAKKSTEILILDSNPKINLELILETENPKLVVITSNNYKSAMALWKKTCRQKNIPFHAISEKGYYIMNVN